MRFPSRFGGLVGAFLMGLLVLSAPLFASPAVRIKDIAYLKGIRENQLMGIGLVMGLAGKGDSSGSMLLKKALSNLMASFGFDVDPGDIKSKNCAVVMVSVMLPAFAREGDRIDLSIASIGDARSLESGILLQTNLKAANGQVYAVAQGKLMVSGAPGSVKTVGDISGGAIVEREILSEFMADGRISVVLRNPDFVTASTVSAVIREAFENIEVKSLDASLIEIKIPENRRSDIVSFIGEMESLMVTPDVVGRVVIDSQSGVIIMGENVRIGKVAVAYRKVSVSVGSFNWEEEEKPDLFVIEDTTQVNDLIELLKTVGLETDAIIEIMRAIERAGALFGRLVIL